MILICTLISRLHVKCVYKGKGHPLVNRLDTQEHGQVYQSLRESKMNAHDRYTFLSVNLYIDQ